MKIKQIVYFSLLIGSCLSSFKPAYAVGYWRAAFEGETFLDAFQTGQEVIIKADGNLFDVTILETNHPKTTEEVFKVVGTGDKFLVLQDSEKKSLIRIPSSAIRRITAPCSH